MFEIEEYQDENGSSPFAAWFDDLSAKDKAIISMELEKMEQGLLGDVKPVGAGLSERRIKKKAAVFRIYFLQQGQELIILFGGSTKKRQQQAIDQAKVHLEDYKAQRKEQKNG